LTSPHDAGDRAKANSNSNRDGTRKAAERVVTGLWDLIGQLPAEFFKAECGNYFSDAGYE
jgi:hypothetical protein